MNPLTVVRESMKYNYWARDRQLQACVLLTEEQFLRPIGGSFSSLRDTLVHMVAVECIWLKRWQGEAPRALLSVDEFPDLAAVTYRWAAVERNICEYLAGLDDATLERPLTYTNTRGEEWTYPLWRMIVHLLNHQSYHRGQVTTLLRMLGAQPPAVDFLVAQDMGLRL